MIKIKYIGLIIFSLCLLYVNTYAKEKNKKRISKDNSINKVTDDPSVSVIDINNITSYVREDGLQPNVIGGQSFNGQFPKGSQLDGIYQEGVLWGGIVSDGQNPPVRVGGATYSEGNVSTSRLFRVRPDYATANLTDDAANFFQETVSDVTSSQIQQVKDQYAKDWQEWPGDKGAPYEDVNNNGKYDPDTDIPGVPGASQTLWIAYNDGQALSLYASPPIGMDVQETFWAYAVSNPLGNVIFKRVRLVYTGTSSSSSNARVDSMYIAQFSDPDVGTYTDDYAGCDTVLDLGYAYNSTNYDNKYSAQGLVAPAMGYDFLQGASYYTGDPNDSAIIDFKYRKGYKYFQDKPMSAFIYFSASGNWSDPTLVSNNGNYDNGTLQMYNLFRGYLPDPKYPASEPFPTNTGTLGGFGTYLLAGDPVTGTGWVDGNVDVAGDRRILCINGPISMQLGDTAEVVIALVGGEGTNNLSSVSVLKYNDQFAQFAYDQFFNIPIMPQPSVEATALDDKVVLNWGSDQNKINAIENSPHAGFDFQGYSVYQLPAGATDLSKGVRVATFDLNDNVQVLNDKVLDQGTGLIYTKPIVFLKNEGIKRYISIDNDALTGKPIINGQSYTFAVTAIGYNNDPGLPYNILESSPVIVSLTPHSANPGVRYGSAVGDTILSVHATGSSDGNVIALVVDPTKLTGDNYKVTFDTLNGGNVWSLTDVTTGTVLVKNNTNQSGDDTYPIIDGMQVKVFGPSAGVKQISELDASDAVVDPNVGLIPISLGTTGYFVSNRAGVANGGDRNYDRFGYWGTDDVIIDFTQESLTWDYINEDVHIDQSTGQPYKAPFAVYRRKFPSGEMVRLFAGFWDTDSNGVWDVDDDRWPEPNYGVPCYEPLYCWQGYDANGNEINYDPANDAQYAADNSLLTSANTTFGSATGPIDYPYLTATLFAMYRDGATPPFGHKVIFITNKPNSNLDEFTLASIAPTDKIADAKADVNKINVFPNPYYGYQYREISRQDHYVTFSHLPTKATIRIFDLAGVLVRTLDHNSSSSQYEQWDLRNDSNYPVASGIYVAYIDLPDQGTSKILKIAVIQEQQVLPVY